MTALSTFCLTTVVCVFFAMLFQRHTATLEIKDTFFFLLLVVISFGSDCNSPEWP